MLMSVTIRGSFTSEDNTSDIFGELVFGAKPDKSDKISLYLNVTDNGSSESFSADLFKGVTTDGTTVWNAVYSLTESNEVKTANSTLTYVKDTGALTLVMTDGEGSSVSVNCSVTSGADGAEISLDSITSAEGENLMDGTKISVRFAKEPIPAVSADKDFLDITEEELDAMGESFGKDFETVLGLEY